MYRLGAVFELRHEEAAAHEVEPAMATRGGRRPRFEPSMATRGRRRPQRASSEQVGGRPHSRRSPEGLAHQSRELARCFGKSPRNLMRGSEPVAGRHRITTRGGCRTQHANSARPSGVWLRAVIELQHEEGAGHNGLGQRLDTTFLRARAAASSSYNTRRVPATTTIQSEAPHSVTGGFGHGRVPLHRVGYNRVTSL